MGARGPAPRPKLQVVKEGNPNRKPRAKLDTQVVLPPGAPAEPDWSHWFPSTPETESESKLAIAEAKKTWATVVPLLDAQGFSALLDADPLTDLCVCQARLLLAERDISFNGVAVAGERGVQKNPSVTAANQIRTHLHALWKQFYMTPASRARGNTIGGADDGGEDDPYD
jgi:P27 family predicted phage terminase small subunit